MNEQPYDSIEQVVLDDIFPDVDLALRRGRHIDMDDTEWFAFLVDAQPHLEIFYRRFDCELIQVTDGYFYLLPSGNKLGRSRLTKAQMLVGQALALIYLDPAMVSAAGVVPTAQLIEVLTNIVGEQNLVQALNPRRSASAATPAAERAVRTEIQRAVRGLSALGFIEGLSDGQLRLRTPLMRFTDPVRGLTDPAEALKILIERGQVEGEQVSKNGEEFGEDDDDEDSDVEDEP